MASHVWNEKGKKHKERRAKKQPGCSDFHYSQLKFKVHHISNYIKTELLEKIIIRTILFEEIINYKLWIGVILKIPELLCK